jgi:hypothetical protein
MTKFWEGTVLIFLPIPDPGLKKAPDPGSGLATLPTPTYLIKDEFHRDHNTLDVQNRKCRMVK